MRTIRHFVDAALAPGARVALPEDAVAHLVRVLRLGVGRSRACCSTAMASTTRAEMLRVAKKSAEAQVLGRRVGRQRDRRLHITLAQGIARGEKMDLILQKATELGVARIAPVVTERTEVRLDAERSAKRMQHWRGVVIAACEQSGRARLPELLEPQAPGEFVAGDGHRAGVSCSTRRPSRASPRPAIAADARVSLLIGPEGGLSERDRRSRCARRLTRDCDWARASCARKRRDWRRSPRSTRCTATGAEIAPQAACDSALSISSFQAHRSGTAAAIVVERDHRVDAGRQSP